MPDKVKVKKTATGNEAVIELDDGKKIAITQTKEGAAAIDTKDKYASTEVANRGNGKVEVTQYNEYASQNFIATSQKIAAIMDNAVTKAFDDGYLTKEEASKLAGMAQKIETASMDGVFSNTEIQNIGGVKPTTKSGAKR
jgi:phage I-like protein